jgi:hypothetical protein
MARTESKEQRIIIQAITKHGALGTNLGILNKKFTFNVLKAMALYLEQYPDDGAVFLHFNRDQGRRNYSGLFKINVVKEKATAVLFSLEQSLKPWWRLLDGSVLALDPSIAILMILELIKSLVFLVKLCTSTPG